MLLKQIRGKHNTGGGFNTCGSNENGYNEQETIINANGSWPLIGLQEHYIVCGFGRKGKAVCRHLQDNGIAFVVIEHSPERLPPRMQREFPVVVGNATEDPILRQAGIEEAAGLIAILGDDSDNVYLVLSARSLNEKLNIIAWYNSEAMEKKLKQAGANRVLAPFHLGANQIAHYIQRPEVVDFVDIALGPSVDDLHIDQITLPGNSPLLGSTLENLALPRHVGVLVLAIHHGNQTVFNPPAQTRFQADDILIVMGNQQQMKRLRDYVFA